MVETVVEPRNSLCAVLIGIHGHIVLIRRRRAAGTVRTPITVNGILPMLTVSPTSEKEAHFLGGGLAQDDDIGVSGHILRRKEGTLHDRAPRTDNHDGVEP